MTLQSEEKLSPLEQLDCWKVLTRKWMAYLPSSELRVLAAIMDRTVNWGKSSEVILMRHLVEGVEGHSEGTGLSRQQISELVRRLEEKGIVNREEHGKTFRYSINYDVDLSPKKPKKLSTPNKKPVNTALEEAKEEMRAPWDKPESQDRGGL